MLGPSTHQMVYRVRDSLHSVRYALAVRRVRMPIRNFRNQAGRIAPILWPARMRLREEKYRLIWARSPKSFNYYLDLSFQAAQIFGSLYETLLSMNPLTLEYVPALAQNWRISDDKKTFTFTIDPNARWSDDRPITSADVKWTYDAVMNPKHLTGSHKISLERFESPEIIDPIPFDLTLKPFTGRIWGRRVDFKSCPSMSLRRWISIRSILIFQSSRVPSDWAGSRKAYSSTLSVARTGGPAIINAIWAFTISTGLSLSSLPNVRMRWKPSKKDPSISTR